jgi:hypothetical protein
VLAFTESVTRLSETHVPDSDYDAVAAELTPDEIGAAWPPGRHAFRSLLRPIRMTS